MIMLMLLKILCLFVALLFTLNATVKTIAKTGRISGITFIILAAAWTGFITLQWLIAIRLNQ